MMVFAGWTWEYIDENMTLPRLYSIYKHWERRPPTHWMIASYFGIGNEPEKSTDANADFSSFLANARGNG